MHSLSVLKFQHFSKRTIFYLRRHGFNVCFSIVVQKTQQKIDWLRPPGSNIGRAARFPHKTQILPSPDRTPEKHQPVKAKPEAAYRLRVCRVSMVKQAP